MTKNIFEISFVIMFIIFLSLSGCSEKPASKEISEIKIAALLALSGELSSKGELRQQALQKGVDFTNTNLTEEGKAYRFTLKVEDSESDPEVALTKAKQLREQGYEIFIAGSSAEVEQLQPWATEQNAIVISYSSSSPTIAIKDDTVFRMVPEDTNQAEALASLLEYEGIYAIIPVFRDDIYGQQFVDLLTEQFEALHGIVAAPLPYNAIETNWEQLVTDIATSAEQLRLEKDRIAVVLVSFDEAAKLLEKSAMDENIAHIRWFGTDSVTLSPIILADKKTAQSAVQVQLTGVTFGIPDSEWFDSLHHDFSDLMNETFLPDALYAFDIFGMLATVIQQTDNPTDINKIKNHMIEGSKLYAGVTGWTILNENGDRKYYHYDVWQVQKQSDTYSWEKIAKYERNPSTSGYITPYE